MRPPLFTARFLRLWIFTFVTFFSAFQLFPIVPFRILDLGGQRAEAGLFLTVYTWASALSAPLTGALADRWGRRRVLLTAAGAFALASLAYSVADGLPVLLSVAALHGIFWSGLLSASGALVVECVPVARRTEGLAWWGMAPTSAMAVAPAVGLAIYRSGGWSMLMGELVLLSVGIGGLAWILGRDRAATTLGTLPSALIDWRVIAASACLFVISFGYGGVTSYVAVLSVERSIEPASLFFTVFAVMVIATRILVAPLGDRLGPVWLLVPCVLFVPPAQLGLAVAADRSGIVFAGVLFGVGFGGAYPAFMAWLMQHTAPERRAATMGSALFALDTGIGLGSTVLGAVADGNGFRAAFSLAAGVAALALPAFAMGRWLLTGPGRAAGPA